MQFTSLLFLLTSSLTLASPVDLSERDLTLNKPPIQGLWETHGNCIAVLRTVVKSKHCGVTGGLPHKFPGEVHKDWTLNHCKNDCVCQGDSCLSFSFRPNANGDRGECIQHKKHLYEMNFSESIQDAGPQGQKRKYFDRTCFHRGKPTATAVHTDTAHATPAPVRRDASLDEALVMAMAG